MTTYNKEQAGMFGATIAFRWAALFHILILLLSKSSTIVPLEVSYGLLTFASAYSALLTKYRIKIIQSPKLIFFLLVFDALLSFVLMAVGGGWRNAWYLYTFSTGLMAAVFYGIGGAMVVSLILCVSYLAALLINGMTFQEMLTPDMLDQIISNFVSYIFAGAFFGYPAMLIKRLHEARMELEEKNNRLKEADFVMAKLQTNTNDIKEMLASVLEPESILKLLVKKQSLAETTRKAESSRLTKREIELLKLVAQGMSNQEISNIMHIAKRTVETHRRNIFQKLGVSTAAHALSKAFQENLIDKDIFVKSND